MRCALPEFRLGMVTHFESLRQQAIQCPAKNFGDLRAG